MNSDRYHGRHLRPEPLRRTAFAAAFIAVAVLSWAGAPSTQARATDSTTPMTAVFFYDQSFRHAADHFQPALSPYSDTNPTHVAAEVAGMRYAGFQAAIASWWGVNAHHENTAFPVLYRAAAAQRLGVIPYYEPEGQGDPSVAQIQADLAYLLSYANANPNAAVRIGGKPVIFVYNAGATGCGEVTKWKTATNGFSSWYVNMKVFDGFRTCPDQPSSWHQYGPAARDGQSVHLPWSFNIAPGFWHYNEATPRLARDPARWAQNVARMKASGAQWQLVTSWNEWGEATSIEPSALSSPATWQSSSGWGTYADELHRQLVEGVPLPSPSPTASASPTVAPSPSGTPTSSPSPTATSPSPVPTTTSPSPSPTTPSPSPTGSPSPSPSPTTPPPVDDVLVMAAGDIVAENGTGYGGWSDDDGETAALLSKYRPRVILTLGDNQYEEGSFAQYQTGWGRTTCAGPGKCDGWGQHLSNVYPAPGNHEWLTPNAQGYRDYFGARLAQIGSDTPSGNQMYYSFDVGPWHFISLDSDCSKVLGCNAGNPQMVWLLADLAANNGRSTVVAFHHPIVSIGPHGSTGGMGYLNSVLVNDHDVQVVLNGHDHSYQRSVPAGLSGPQASGVRYFVVGTGGKNHTGCGTPTPVIAVCNGNTFGVLGLTLHADGSYDWLFHPVTEPIGFTDSGHSARR
jgi:Calcineurin-like phosphoesterase